MSEAKFEECDDVTTLKKTNDICSSHGPAIAVTIELVLASVLLFFIIIFKKRFHAQPKIKDVELPSYTSQSDKQEIR